VLFLLFQLGDERYALDAGRVVEVLPLLQLTAIPNAPRGVAGMFNYRGRPVPAVDLCQLILGRAARERLHTRILLVNYADDAGQGRLLGLIAEHATQVLRRDRKDFVESGLRLDATPYLGPILMDEHGIVRWLREDQLLTESVRHSLFAGTTA
jgi:chemotaxis-related protein WspB